MSSFKNRSSQELIEATNLAISVIGTAGAAPFHVDAATMQALVTLNTDLKSAQEDQTFMLAAAKASTTTKLRQMGLVEDAITAIQAKVAADPSVSTSDLDRAGFSRRGSGKAEPKVPGIPTALAVVANNDGTALVRWKKAAGSPASTSFLVERSFDGLNFEIADSTQAQSYTIDAVPGVACYYRVTARTKAGRSIPSATAGVYLPSAPARPALKLA